MEYAVGMFARSLAGHDKGKLYLITRVDTEYVYLADGKLRLQNCPKKKKKRHIQIDYHISELINKKIASQEPLRDEDIKRAIKEKVNGG